jgi:ribonuclease T1
VFFTGRAWSASSVRRAVLKLGLAAWLGAGGVDGAVWARTPETPTAVPPVALVTLPPEAQTTYQLIHAGGPFPYRKDGTVFGNRERLLPQRSRGHYREYTVRTPGSSDRGARRIVCGGTPPTRPEACYYTADHYSSFRRIVQ